jgi:hypothetical protein
LALVVDPCRGDRGMFMWTGDTRERIRRCGGFYLIASRFRREELEFFAAHLEGKQTMPATDPRFGAFPIHMSTPAPVVNISESRNSWHGPMIAGMLTVQLLVLVLLAWKLLDPLSGVAGKEDDDKPKEKTVAQQIEELRRDVMQSRLDEQRAQAQNDAQRQILRTIVANMQDGSNTLVDQFEERQIEVDQLKSDLRGQNALVVTLDSQLKDLKGQRDENQKKIATLEYEKKKHADKITSLNAKAKEDGDQIKQLTDSVDELTDRVNGKAINPVMVMFWVYLAVAALVGGVIGAGVVFAARRNAESDVDEDGYERDDSRSSRDDAIESQRFGEPRATADDGRADGETGDEVPPRESGDQR